MKITMAFPESPAENGPFLSSLSWNDLTSRNEQESVETGIEMRQRSSSICVLGICDAKKQKTEITFNDFAKQSYAADKYDALYLDLEKGYSTKMKKGNYAAEQYDFIS